MKLIDADMLKSDYVWGGTTTGSICTRYVSKKQIDEAPTIDTIYGYPIKHLILLASACRQQGITENELHDFIINVQSAYDFVHKEFENSLKEYIEGMMIHETD